MVQNWPNTKPEPNDYPINQLFLALYRASRPNTEQKRNEYPTVIWFWLCVGLVLDQNWPNTEPETNVCWELQSLLRVHCEFCVVRESANRPWDPSMTIKMYYPGRIQLPSFFSPISFVTMLTSCIMFPECFVKRHRIVVYHSVSNNIVVDEKKWSHSLSISDIATEVVPLCSMHKVSLHEYGFNSPTPVSMKFAFLSMLFILELVWSSSREFETMSCPFI